MSRLPLVPLLLVLAACGDAEPYTGKLADLPPEDRYAAVDAAYDLGYQHSKDAICAVAETIGNRQAARKWEREGKAEHEERRAAARAAYIDPSLRSEYDEGYRDADADVSVDLLLGGSPCGLLQQASSLFGG